jgi:hypothetical protein
MKQAFLTLLLLLGLTAPSLRAAQTETYHLISGTVSNPPPINAVTVENVGNVTLFNTDDIPFDFQSMQNFINRQFITSAPGIQFDNFNPTNYLRSPLTLFQNEGTILATTRLSISANTILNNDNALLSTGRGGKVSLDGQTVNLQGGLISAGEGSSIVNATEGATTIRVNNNFFYLNPLNVRDEYWASTNGGNLSLPFMSFGGVTPSELVTFRGSPSGFRYSQALDVNANSFFGGGLFFPTNAFTTNGYLHFASTNNYNFINNTTFRNTIQLVFIRTNQFSPDIQVAFPGSTNSAGFLINDIAVQFATTDTDPLTGQQYQRYLTLLDESGFRARVGSGGPTATLGLQANYDRPGYFRPLAYTLIRSDFPLFFGLSTPATPYTNIVYPGSGNFNERFVTNLVNYEFSSWGFTLSPRDFGGDLGVDPVLSDPTNSPGRVEINAADLNISYSTIKAENLLSITGTNGVNLTGANLSAPTVSLKVPGSVNLTLSNNFPDTVVRLNGQVAMWTGVWQVDQRVTNTAFLPGFTGTVEHAYQILVIDNTLVTNTPVQLRDFVVQSPEVVIGDNLNFGGNLNIGGNCLHIATNGSVTLSADNPDFTVQDAPNLKCLENEGQFIVPGLVSIGNDRPLAYTNVANSGTMQGSTIQIRSDSFTNSGAMSSTSGSIGINATSNFFNGGFIAASGGNMDLAGNHLSATGSVLFTSQRLSMRITNFLGDNGITNQFFVNNGMRLLSHPNKGDLMATHITSTVGNFVQGFHTWAGEDRGATPSGYANNTAIQHLTLNGGTNSTFVFQGATTGNALYVNYLEFLGGTTNTNGVHISSTLRIDPSITIYFADSNVPEDKLTNAFPGRLIWVDPAITVGPMVAVPTTAGQYVSLTTRAAQLMLATGGDADGDGIENERDPSPLSGFTVSSVSVVNLPPLTAFIKWQAKQGVLYTVEYRESLDSTNWKTLYSITADVNKEITAIDVPPNGTQRFYRVRFTLN